MNAFHDAEGDLQISFPLVCGLCWEHSSAVTSHSLKSLSQNRRLFWRRLSSRGLPFWILFCPFGLTPLFVRLHCHGEHEVGFYVPVLTGGRPEGYRHFRPLPHTLGKPLRLVLQHGCGGLPLEARKGDLMNRLPPRWPAPHSMEPETPKPEGSQWFTSFVHGLLAFASRKTGCGIATGMMSLISETVTSMKRGESSFSGEASHEPAACHTCRCM